MNRSFLLVAVLAAMTGGCTTPELRSEVEETHKQIERAIASTTQSLNRRRRTQLFHTAPEAWIGGRTVDVRRAPDPRLNIHVEFSSAGGATIEAIAADITSVTGYPVVLSPDLYLSHVVRSGLQLSPSAHDTLVTTEAQENQALPDIVSHPIVYRHAGQLHHFLDLVASAIGAAWRWDGGRIVFSRFHTRTYRVGLLPGSTQSELTLTGSAITTATTIISAGTGQTAAQPSTESAVPGSTQTTRIVTRLDPWPALTAAVAAMLSPAGEMVASSSLGTITVRDVPAVVDAVGAYITRENTYLTRMVNVEIRLIGIRTDKSTSFAVDWSVILDTTLGLVFQSPETSGPDGAGTLAMRLLRPESPWEGTAAVARALQATNTITTDKVFRATGLTNTVMPIQITSTDGYTASRTVNVPDNGEPFESSTAGRITTGTVMQIIPRLMTDRDLLLRIAIDLSTLLGRRDLPGGVQIPITRQQAIAPAALMRSGDILVLDALSEHVAAFDESGLPTPLPWWAGYSQNISQGRTHLLLLVQPTLLSPLDRNQSGT